MKIIHFLLLIISFIVNIKCDVFTAMVDLENLLASETDVTSAIIENYINAERSRLDRLQK